MIDLFNSHDDDGGDDDGRIQDNGKLGNKHRQHTSQSLQTSRKSTNKGNNKVQSMDYHMDHRDDGDGDDAHGVPSSD
ncbi:hypothetical protein L2E82_22244 [Cichorium intybus]|uniref:Uncharacterized protein n=1 Tax=Cichorium intybus TaxID=13427 RepID=A0ACB9DY87_CICIN|nr:hypothetical protein L2E82_22244 [Cichorium intybus]